MDFQLYWKVWSNDEYSHKCDPMWAKTLCTINGQKFKTESARRWSNKWTKILYQDYLHCIANFCRALSIIFSKQFISSNTKRRKRMLNFVWNTLKVLVKWNWWWSFVCVSTKPLNFEIYFFSFPWEIIFRYYFRQLCMFLAFKKCKNDCQIFEITLVQMFVH